MFGHEFGRALKLALAAGAFVLGSGCQNQTPGEGGAKAAMPAVSSVSAERGEYLVTVMGCNDCHTPWTMGPDGPAPDMSRMLSGHPESLKMPPAPDVQMPWMLVGSATLTCWHGPWGTSYAANLTPDQNTGLGIWTEEMFVNALRQGKHMGTSRPIQPPMPWQWYGKLNDDDLKSVFAYLRAIPPIENHVPEWEPPGGTGD